MAKKKLPKRAPPHGDASLAAQKFSGFKPLAAGLGDLKAKLEQEKQKKEDEARLSTSKRPPPPPVPRPAPPPKRTAESDRDDELAFHRMMSGVKPLAGRSSRVPLSETPRDGGRAQAVDLRKKASEEAASVLDHLRRLVDDGVRFEVTDDGRRVEGRRLDVPPSLVRELRRGLLPIDGRLDLHGLVVEDARERLLEFLRAQRARGERCVLVIHGKGEHSVAGGVLRGEIAAWLSQGRAREHVAAFATAREDDGGEGAVYVALRR
jgi:DNA-nicking Smr family endonuclease